MISFILHLQNNDGSDSIAVQLADEAHWNDLVIIIAVVCDVHLTYLLLRIICCSITTPGVVASQPVNLNQIVTLSILSCFLTTFTNYVMSDTFKIIESSLCKIGQFKAEGNK